MTYIKIISLILAILFVILIFFGFFYYKKEPKLSVNFLDVGQGDASLLKLPNGQKVLIDGGPDKRVLRRLGAALPWYDRSLDFIILSHYHDDHLFGLHEVLRRYRVRNLVLLPGDSYTPVLLEILSTAASRGTAITFLINEAQINFSSACELNLLNPLILGVKSNENNSVVSLLDCAGQRFLFSGDNEAAVERALLDSNRDCSADIFKASHHGSKTSNTAEFLEAVGAKYFVISVGEGNNFGHPAPEVLERVEAMGMNIYRSDQLGSISFSGYVK